jgi:hypothetical protein
MITETVKAATSLHRRDDDEESQVHPDLARAVLLRTASERDWLSVG